MAMLEPIEITRLQQRVEKHPNVASASSMLEKVNVLSVTGLHGSSRALFTVSLFKKRPGTYLYILNNAETAGYFYHDAVQIMGSERVLFFPSAYKRAAKYGQLDPANLVLRTEVLTRLQDQDEPLLIVSYPDALTEKTVSGEHLEKNTLKVKVGDRLDPSFVSEVLESFGFQQVDYVYEPGQYAVRGSILDLFSFACEYPYRVDFFGDEVDTIRRSSWSRSCHGGGSTRYGWFPTSPAPPPRALPCSALCPRTRWWESKTRAGSTAGWRD